MKYAQYIQKIDINSLWSGRKHIVWEPHPDVNVLSGRNGEGKSTILNKIIHHLRTIPTNGEVEAHSDSGVTLDLFPKDATSIRYDIIRSFDRRMIVSDTIAQSTDVRINSELDWQLYLLQRRYLNYQVNLGNKMIELLTEGGDEAHKKAQSAAHLKNRFLDIIDELFAETGKTIDRKSNELRFLQYGENLSPYVLSSGEKQMLIILLTVITEEQKPYVLCMDEPEASLHFEWQKKLISLVRELNPNAQIILTTHSPAVIMDGWQDAVTEITDITIK